MSAPVTNLELTLADVIEIIGWSGEVCSPDYALIDKLEKLETELQARSKPRCSCCEYGCCTDPEHCCQGHTCGKSNYQVIERTIREIVPMD